jgi:hypothetical protein
MGPCRPILISQPLVYCTCPFDDSTASRLYYRERGTEEGRERREYVCVCESGTREGARERERERERGEREREREKESYHTQYRRTDFTYPPSDIPSPTMAALG